MASYDVASNKCPAFERGEQPPDELGVAPEGAGLHGGQLRSERGGPQGKPVQVDPMKPKLKPPGTERLKAKCDVLLSISGFQIQLAPLHQGPG